MAILNSAQIAKMQNEFVIGASEPLLPTHQIPEVPAANEREEKSHPRLNRREFMGLGVAGAVTLVGLSEAEAQGKPLKLKVRVDDYPPLPVKKLDETHENYKQRYQAHFNRHINGYLRSMRAALINHQAFPLCQEDVDGYARCINPVGKPISGSDFALPCLLLGNKEKGAFPQSIDGVVTEKGMTLEITLGKDGAAFQVFGGMDGCTVALRRNGQTSQPKPFPAGNAAQQQLKLPKDGGKKGDTLIIEIPAAIIEKSLGQLQRYDEQMQQLQQQFRRGF
jgi:hypothetical protein